MVNFTLSPDPSRRSTNPRPYFSCLTCEPGINSLPLSEEDEPEGLPVPAALSRSNADALVGFGVSPLPASFGLLPMPFLLKNSAIASALLYVLPEYRFFGFGARG